MGITQAPQGAKLRIVDTVLTNGALDDTTTPVKCNVLNPSGSFTYTYGIDPEMGRTSLGLYFLLKTADVGGDWSFTFYVLEDVNDDPGASYAYHIKVVGNTQVGA